MDVTELIDELSVQGGLLASAAERAGLNAAVPGCPDWTVRDLVTHTGGIHRWAAAIVGGALRENDDATGDAVGTGPGDDELLGWFRDGHAALVTTLRDAPADMECFTFLPAPSSRAFWARRQAHETAVHRADAEGAAGGAAVYDSRFAQDGIGEMLTGFAARRSNAIATPATLVLQASDGPSWRVILGGERIVAQPVAEPVAASGAADATIAGSSSDLYLWLWNRPSRATVSGDADVAALWRSVRVRWA